jgi:hypothetical protein
LSVPVRATQRQDCDESHPQHRVDKLLIRPTHGDRAGAGDRGGHVHFKAPSRPNSISGHTPATGASLNQPTLRIGGSSDSQTSFEPSTSPLRLLLTWMSGRRLTAPHWRRPIRQASFRGQLPEVRDR